MIRRRCETGETATIGRRLFFMLNGTTSIGSPHFGSVERVTRAGMGQSHRQLAPTDLVGAFFFGVTELPDVEVSKLQSKSVEARPYRHWGPLDCHCPSQAARPQFPRGQLPTFRATKEMISHLVRRKSRTSAWRPSMSLTRKTSEPARA